MQDSQEEGFNFHESLGRIGPFSVADTLSTAVGGYFLAKVTGWDTTKTIVGLFVVGEAVHYAVGVDTPITKFLKEQF